MPGPGQARGASARCSSGAGIGWEEVAFVGDDLADLQVLRRVGLPVAVANAVAEVKAVAPTCTRAPRRPRRGARGRSRRCSRRADVWAELLERYFTEPAIRAA